MTPTSHQDLHSDAFNHGCPLCKGELRRTWRRPVDRFASLFMPLHRYRCATFSCQWEGNFRVHRAVLADTEATHAARLGAKPVSSHLPTLIASGSALAAVVVVVLIGSQWQPGVLWDTVAATRDDTAVASTSPPPYAMGQEIPVGPRKSPATKPP